MSKYTQLTTTNGINPDDVIYMPTHHGQTPCTVLEVNPENNTVKAVFKELLDGLNKPGAFAHPDVAKEMILNSGLAQFMPVTGYYKKHIPKPRTAKPKSASSEDNEPIQPRTPDMYDFDY